MNSRPQGFIVFQQPNQAVLLPPADDMHLGESFPDGPFAGARLGKHALRNHTLVTQTIDFRLAESGDDPTIGIQHARDIRQKDQPIGPAEEGRRPRPFRRR